MESQADVLEKDQFLCGHQAMVDVILTHATAMVTQILFLR